MKLESDKLRLKSLEQDKEERLREGGMTYEDFEDPIEIPGVLEAEVFQDLQEKAKLQKQRDMDPLER